MQSLSWSVSVCRTALAAPQRRLKGYEAAMRRLMGCRAHPEAGLIPYLLDGPKPSSPTLGDGNA